MCLLHGGKLATELMSVEAIAHCFIFPSHKRVIRTTCQKKMLHGRSLPQETSTDVGPILISGCIQSELRGIIM